MSNANNNEKEKATLTFEEFADFEGTMVSKIINSHNLAKMVNERLQPVFKDYRGCFIEPLPTGTGVGVTLIFNQLSANQVSEDDMCAFRSIEMNKGGGSIAERSSALTNGMRSGRKFHITDDAASMLGAFFRNPEKINWNNAAGENYQQNGAFHEGYNYVTGLDIGRILESMLFGSTNGNNDKVFYNLVVLQAIQNSMMNMGARPNNWLLRIDMMTSKSEADMLSEAGMIAGNINCITGF